jgi:hypothetical protein
MKVSSVSWFLFTNRLNEFFVRATRQDLLEISCLSEELLSLLPVPKRALEPYVFDYIHHSKFGGKDSISLDDFEDFWDWFGALCHQYRHNMIVRSMYLSGLIYGLISNADCDTLLQGKDDGLFMICNTGKSEFQIFFTHCRKVMVHRIDPKKLRSPYGNLADFVKEKRELRLVVKPFHENDSGTIISEPVAIEKDTAFADFYSLIKGGGVRKGALMDEEDE